MALEDNLDQQQTTEPIVTDQPKQKAPVVTKEQQDALDKFNYVTSNLGQIAGQNSVDQNFFVKPYSYDPKSTTDSNQNFERYYSHSSFKKLGFNPWQDNETLYNEKGSAWGDVWRATKAGAKMIPTGFMSAVRSYGDILSGDPLAQDAASAEEMSRLNTVGGSSRAGVAGFASNLLLNSGYTIGLGLEMAAEATMGAVLAPETGGASAGIAIGRIANSAKTLGNYFNVVKGFNKAVDGLKNFNAAKFAYDTFKATGKFLNPLSNTTDAIRALNASENLTNLAKISKTAAAFHKDVMLTNATLAEAKLEGASTANELEQELTADFYKEHGYYPTPTDLVDIKSKAQEAGDKTLAWNIPVILLTNKITFDPLLRRFAPMEDYITKAGTKFIEKKGTGFVKEGFGTGIKGVLKPKVYGKAGLTYFKENFTEGLQESLQEVIAGTSRDYYRDMYNNPSKQGLDQTTGENYSPDLAGIVGKNVADQFSGKGFETFASGFFMGGLMKIQGGLYQAGKENYNRIFNKERYVEYKKQKEEYNTQTLARLNELYKDPLKYFGTKIINYANSSSTIDNQNAAATDNDVKGWQDVDDQNVWSHISTALDTGTYDVFVDKINSIKTMDPKAIQEAYGVDGQEALAKLNKVLDRASYIKDGYEKWGNKAINPFNPKAFPKDSPEYEQEAIAYSSWEQARKNAIFYSYSLDRNVDRIRSVQDGILSTDAFKNTSSTDITVLFDLPSLNKELSFLKQETSLLKDAVGVDAKKDLANKQTKFEKLQDFRSKLENYYIYQSAKGLPEKEREEYFATFKDFEKTTDDDLKKAYKDYLKHIAVQNKTFYFSDISADESYKAIKDLHTLKSENRNLNETINMLANPKGFYDHYNRLNEIFNNLYKDRDKNLKEGLESTYSRIEINNLLNSLFRLGYVVNEAEIKEITEQGKIPEQFYSVLSKQIVRKGDRDYTAFEAIIKDFLNARQGEVEETVGPDVEQEAIVKFAADIKKGIKKDSPEDIQFYENHKGAIEAELLKLQTVEKTVVEPAAAKVIIPYNIQEKLDAIETGQDLVDYENEIMGILGSYDKAVEAGIDKSIQEQIIKVIAEKEKTLVESFDPSKLEVGNVVVMKEKDKTGIVEKITKDYIVVELLGEGQIITTTIKTNNISKSIKFKYSDAMQEEKVNLGADEKQKAQENINSAEELMQNTAALKELQTEAEKEGADKVTDDFIKNLGCK